MRTLKKSLAVLLVLVMALTMVPFAGANQFATIADFPDAADVTQERDILMALDVLAAVNVLRGEDGLIAPQRTLNRAEAATVVARVLLGPITADTLPASQTGFRDVDGVSGLGFASGAIGYLHERGIVIGIGDNLFDPFASVTGAEIATMFLRAVGFGVNGEYTGPRWQTNAVVDGMSWRILQGDADFTAPATREEIFFYAFNAMNVRGSDVGLRFVNWSADRQAYVPVLLQGIGAGDGERLETIFRRVFNPSPINLHWNLTHDQFGRPADRFTLRGIEIGTYAQDARLRYTAHVGRGAIDADLNVLNIGQTNVNVNNQILGTNWGVDLFVNGSQQFINRNRTTAAANDDPFTFLNNADWGNPGLLSATSNTLINPTRANVAAFIEAHVGNGVEVEVFVDDATNNIIAVTVIRTDISRMTAISGQTRTVTTRTPDFGGETTPAPGIRTATFGFADAIDVGVLNPNHAEVAALAINDFLLVRPVWDGGAFIVGEVAAPESVTAIHNAGIFMVNFGGNTGTITVGGEVYRRARVLSAGAQALRHPTVVNTEATLLLDEFGFVVHADGAAQGNRNVIIVNSGNNNTTPPSQGALLQTLTNNQLRNFVRGFYTDGTAVDVTLHLDQAVPGFDPSVPIGRGAIAVIVQEGAAANVQSATPAVGPNVNNARVSTLALNTTGTTTPSSISLVNVSTDRVTAGQTAVRTDVGTFEIDNTGRVFYINPANGAVTVRNRDHTIQSDAIEAIISTNAAGASTVIAFVVHGAVMGDLNRDTLFFVEAVARGWDEIAGVGYNMFWTTNADGVRELRALSGVTGTDGLPEDGAGFRAATIDAQGRLVTTGILDDELGSNVGIVTMGNIATVNGLANTIVVSSARPSQIVGGLNVDSHIAAVPNGVLIVNAVTSATMTRTAFFEQLNDGRIAADRLVSVLIDVAATGSPVVAIFLH
ncbi:MAG: S-layer homology domain-containing protein [Oscillospiraceae bacterium]|nr:S-layer homology domain-containing protein [Oscillospiraceae bacterium]